MVFWRSRRRRAVGSTKAKNKSITNGFLPREIGVSSSVVINARRNRGRPSKSTVIPQPSVCVDSDSNDCSEKSSQETSQNMTSINQAEDSDSDFYDPEPKNINARSQLPLDINSDSDDGLQCPKSKKKSIVIDSDEDVENLTDKENGPVATEKPVNDFTGNDLERADSSEIRFDSNFDLDQFIANTSNIQSSSVSTHSDKVTKSGRIDDDFFENLPDFDVNELSTSKKRKGAKKSLSTIADYLTSSTLTSNAGTVHCQQSAFNSALKNLTSASPSTSNALLRDDSITTSLKRCIDFNDNIENLPQSKKSKTDAKKKLSFSRQPLEQLDNSMQDASDESRITEHSDEEMEDCALENMQSNLNPPNVSINLPNWSEDITFDVNSILKNASRKFQLENMGGNQREVYLREESDTAECIIKMYDAIKEMPKDGVERDPEGLKDQVKLMTHQRQSLKWMRWRETKETKGGILADDMGLGKTLQLVSLILSHKNDKIAAGALVNDDDDGYVFKDHDDDGLRKIHEGRTLVICPSYSLLEQWKKEVVEKVERNRLKVLIYHGKESRSIDIEKLAKIDIVMTTYSLLVGEKKRSDVPNIHKEKNPNLFRIHWERVILDEAHAIRNVSSLTCESVCELRATARWAVTGTPIQNKEDDFYALLKFLKCRPFDDYHVWKRWVNNTDPACNQRLVVISKSIMLRRTKAELMKKGDIKKLPDKLYDIIYVKLDRKERIVYEKMFLYCNTFFEKFLRQKKDREHLKEFGSHARPSVLSRALPDALLKLFQLLSKSQVKVGMHMILVFILRLRQMCCHPALAKSMLDELDLDLETPTRQVDGNVVALIDELFTEDGGDEEGFDLNINSHRAMTKTNEVFDYKRIGSKVKAILKVIRNLLEKDEKIIVVSQWTGFLQVIANSLLTLKDRGAVWAMFTGKVSQQNKQEIIDRLNCEDDKLNIVLLSLTGGFGLNLVGANNLLLVDLHWNPQLENQAQDRIYRFGQKHNVHVYKFICKDTIEEKIKELQDDKLAIADNLLNGTVNNRLTIEDMKKLFSLDGRADFEINGEYEDEDEDDNDDDEVSLDDLLNLI